MTTARLNPAACTRAARWVALVLAVVLAIAVVLTAIATAPARADPGTTPDPTGPDQQTLAQQQAALEAAVQNGTPTGSYTGPEGNVRWVGVPGTHSANHFYGYPYAAAGDCNEATLGGGCVGDARGFYEGQCTSWVAFRLAARNGVGFSNWYADRHWGDAADWAKVAKSIGHKPDKYPAVGSIGWYKRGHVSYVEGVNSDGSLLISQMNTDGHNGFAVSTVYPGSSSWPDKFIHLADVVPIDTAPPTVPAGLHAVAHRGRTGIAWRASTDAWGVAGYRVLRNGVPLAGTGRTSYWDTSPPVGQTTVYSVVAYDGAGHTSAPARVRVAAGAEAVDRAWVETDAGPALCGRTGTERRPGLGCRVLGDSGWRDVRITQKTPWGGPLTRAFVPSRDGGVAYCRAVGASQRRLACTDLDPDRLAWGFDSTSGRTPAVDPVDRTWLATAAGPALCGRTGTGARPRVTCSVLTSQGWRSETSPTRTTWGMAGTRAFVANRDGSVAFCRALQDGADVRYACTILDTGRLSWRRESISRRADAGFPADGTWLATTAGPGLCWSPGSAAAGGCRVLTEGGWRTALLPRRVDRGMPASRAFLTDASGRVSLCAIATTGASVACTTLAADQRSWGRSRSTRLARSWQADNRTWTATSAGPALCGRTGTPKGQRLGCQVLTDRGWRFTGSHRVAWGNAGYRAFVPSGAGVAYCSTVVAKRGTAVACTRMSNLEWGATRTSHRVRLAYADPF